MAGAIDLMLYGIAVFVSPVAVYSRSLLFDGCTFPLSASTELVPGIIHAFYIIHTTKNKKNTEQQSQPYPQTAQRRSASLPSLPHSSRYRPQADFAPYEDHPPPIPPKTQDAALTYDPSLHPNSANRSIARAKSVLHTYQIRNRLCTQHHLDNLVTGAEAEVEPQPQPVSETRASSSTLHPDPNPALPYPAEYHPNSAGENISRAKAVLHTYQIPETTFPPRIEEETPAAATTDEAPKQSKPTSSIKGSMWPLRSKGKGLSPLDMNSPAAVPKPDSTAGHKSRWVTSGPSWLRRRRGREDLQNGGVGEDNESPNTMTMVWDDNFETLRPRERHPKQAKTHARTESEPISLSFPAPPGAIRPVIDHSGLEAVAEDGPMPENTVSEGEEAGNGTSPFQDEWRAETDTELSRSKGRLISRFGRRPHRSQLDTVMDTTPPPPPPPPPSSSASDPTQTNSPSLHAYLAISHRPLSWHPASTNHVPVVSAPTHFIRRCGWRPLEFESTIKRIGEKSPDFAMGEYGLGQVDLYVIARGLTSPINGNKRLSVGTTFSQSPTAASASTPVMRREWTQGTFGTGITSETSERARHGGSEERSPEEEIEEWIKREDERREASATNSQAHTPNNTESSGHGVTPDAGSIFSAESSGFAGIGWNMELWDQPNWDGSNPSIGHTTGGHSHASPHQYGYPNARVAGVYEAPFDDSARNPAAARSTASHSSYATGQESFATTSAPISPPVSPSRPVRPTRAPPAVPAQASPSASAERSSQPGVQALLATPPVSPPRPPPGPSGSSKPPPVPARPGSVNARAQSPKLPPKPTVLRTMSSEDDDMSDIYARALRDEI
ncbi:hypothetical protein RhiXN_10904 [Rhizoctonia solani]|uniref:Uncharacterized protein n=1 Tax=Rhizoctonia solani TaxID=456999 RepID=A0A8H8T2G9_9AGAM|nr:uncharacterized protein RhiXN_10904 [Rhizoctonia solani]QRW25827.1 hypothetical protein RhiXN_10904 [Rhizoctonia solani]